MTRNDAIEYLLSNMSDSDHIIGINVDNLLNKTADPKILEACKILNFVICANGCMYSRDKQGFMPEMVEKMFADRKVYKKEMLDAEQEYERINEEIARRGLKV